jgi:hypothetical protein
MGVGFGGTGFSLCGFDLWQAKVKRTQAEACATKVRVTRYSPREWRQEGQIL